MHGNLNYILILVERILTKNCHNAKQRNFIAEVSLPLKKKKVKSKVKIKIYTKLRIYFPFKCCPVRFLNYFLTLFPANKICW